MGDTDIHWRRFDYEAPRVMGFISELSRLMGG